MIRRTTIEIEEELLARAQKALGTSGLKETVDAALGEVVRASLRKRLAGRLRSRRGIDIGTKTLRASREWRTR
jgi:Arc/MetJ family transcription regulator